MLTSFRREQNEMMQKLAMVMQKPPSPDASYSWAQAPVKFEDALGRVIPVASEYDWKVSTE